MLVDIGGEYKYLEDNKDYLQVIEDKISWEFADEIARRLDEVRILAECLREDADSDFKYLEAENENLRNLIDDVNSELQHYLVPIEQGKRINRQEMIKLLNRVIKMLNGR